MTTKADILETLAKVGDDEVFAMCVPLDVHDFRYHFMTKADAEQIYEDARKEDFYCGSLDTWTHNDLCEWTGIDSSLLEALPLKSNLTLEEWKEVVSLYKKQEYFNMANSDEKEIEYHSVVCPIMICILRVIAKRVPLT
jgi:hypothetical protein